MSAAAKVAGTYELIESIILHLPLRDLYPAQNINRFFRSVWKDSTKIQQVAFLAPYPQGQTASYDEDRKRWTLSCSAAEIRPILNPHVLRKVLLSSTRMRPSVFHDSLLTDRSISYASPSSGHRMFVTQPPLGKMIVADGVIIENGAGVRVDNVIREVRRKGNFITWPYLDVVGGENLDTVVDALDEVSGWETLAIFERMMRNAQSAWCLDPNFAFK